jgi:fructosamine-3-kinase
MKVSYEYKVKVAGGQIETKHHVEKNVGDFFVKTS